MKLFNGFLLAAATAQAHYTFPRLVVNSVPEPRDWTATRMTKNAQTKQGVENPLSPDIRCYTNGFAAEIIEVPAGATVHYISTQQVNHPGPTQYYLAKVPEGQSAKTWNGDGSVWFRFHTEMPMVDGNRQLVWPGQNEYKTTNATIPAEVPDGEYLLRVEHIALHMASQPNKAQFYISCSQIRITGGGNATPGPLSALPGAYKTADPGILVNLYSMQPSAYQPPGPALWPAS